jgi:hypothetical protein
MNVVLLSMIAGAPAAQRAGAAHEGDDEIARLEGANACSGFDHLGQRFMSEDEVLRTGEWKPVCERADLPVRPA